MSVNISFADHRMELQSQASLGELIDSMADCDGGRLMLGMEEEAIISFQSIVIDLAQGRPSPQRVGIGLCTQGSGVSPQLLLLPHRERLVIGLNSEIVGVDVRGPAERFRIRCTGPFYAFHGSAHDNLILGIYELGSVAFDEAGREKWRWEHDVLSWWAVEDQDLLLAFMDGMTKRIRIESGSESIEQR